MKYSQVNRVKISTELRMKTANAVAEILIKNKNLSEVQFIGLIRQKLLDGKKVHESGYYSPPPFGVAALFGSSKNFKRLSFGTLRSETSWPKDRNILKNDGGIGTFYLSPVDTASGMVGDYGVSIYNGEDKNIQRHFKNCVKVLEKTAEFARVGMELRELYEYYNKLMKKYSLPKTLIILQKHNKKVGDNLGHTIPWSYEEPTDEEQKIISGNNFNKIKDVICSKRIFINSKAKFKIPTTIVFTLEFRAGSTKPPLLPNTSFHMMVSFTNGKKSIHANFSPVFNAFGMNFIKSKY